MSSQKYQDLESIKLISHLLRASCDSDGRVDISQAQGTLATYRLEHSARYDAWMNTVLQQVERWLELYPAMSFGWAHLNAMTGSHKPAKKLWCLRMMSIAQTKRHTYMITG